MTEIPKTRQVSLSVPLTDSEKEAFDRFSLATGYRKGAWIRNKIIEQLEKDGYLQKQEEK